MGEIGKNLMLLESGPDLVAIDCGLAFPKDNMPGIDVVIPDVSYLLERKDRLRGIVLTHGHEDHVGALPWVLRDLTVPVYGTRLTLGLASRKMNENFEGELDFRVVAPRDLIQLGSVTVQPFRVTHSVSDSVGLLIHTPAGEIVHTGDFKLDQTPVDGETTDYGLLAAAGERGVLALLSDSTHADRPGFTPSERTVGENLSHVFQKTNGRIIITSFASSVPRIQQVIDVAHRFGRKVCIVGRSMETVVDVSLNMGYLKAPMGTVIDVEDMSRYPLSKIVVLSTGSQGEPLSVLARMSQGEHRQVQIVEGDLVIMAATPVPGNETMVSKVVDNLFRQGATVIYGPESGVHVSGHASQEELKIMLNLTRPRFFIPVHGDYRHMVIHAGLAEATGVPASNILIGENGSVFRISPYNASIVGTVPTQDVLIDDLGPKAIDDWVLKERQFMGECGVVAVTVGISEKTGDLVGEPVIQTAGFMQGPRAAETAEALDGKIRGYFAQKSRDKKDTLERIEQDLIGLTRRYLRSETGQRPIVLCSVRKV